MKEEAGKKEPSPGAPKSITKVFAARHLSTRGPDSLAYAVFDFRGVMFVDLQTLRVNGYVAPYRIFVIKKNDEKWYVYPTPATDSLLSAGLNSEVESTQDFSKAYDIQKRRCLSNRFGQRGMAVPLPFRGSRWLVPRA